MEKWLLFHLEEINQVKIHMHISKISNTTTLAFSFIKFCIAAKWKII